MRIQLYIKLIVICLIFVTVLFIGVYKVAPIGVLKTTKILPISTSSDFGMRYEPLLVVTEDSLNLYGEINFPFQTNLGDAPPNYALIILHPINSSSLRSWQYCRDLISLNINLLTFDLRAHGRSEGEYFTLGEREISDISKLISLVRETYPNMKFGIWGIGNAGNLALKAMEKLDIKFGIVETYYKDPVKYINILNKDDVGLKIPFLNKLIVDESFKYHQILRENITVHEDKIHQPILFLDFHRNNKELYDLYQHIDSNEKIWFRTTRQKLNGHYYPDSNDEYFQCLREFITLQLSQS